MMVRSRAGSAALTAAIFAAIAAGARAETLPVVSASPAVIDALAAIDFPVAKADMDLQRTELSTLMAGDTVASLAALAEAQGDVDDGVRLRAVRAIALYPSDEARAVLTTSIQTHAGASAGTEVLLLRGAVEALGLIGQPADVDTLVPLLDKDDSRDVRAAAARALRDIGSSTAIGPLRMRLGKETVPQVQFAISDALRVLSGTPP